jgi:hypothetical protein
MVFKRLGVLSALAILPAVAQVSETAPQPVPQNEFRLRHGPIRNLLLRDDGTATSTNWSGYVVTGSSFTNAIGSWIQPTVTCSTGTEYAAFWVGIDGYSDGTVEQTGTLAECFGGTPVYSAWYEFYPLEAIIIIPSIVVKPGDKIYTDVKYSGGEFILTIKDETTGKAFQKKGNQSATRSSAEWIAEAPCCSGSSPYPLADFGTALFGKDSTSIANTNYAVETSHSGAFNTFPGADVIAITMVNGTTSAQEAVPSSPSSDGSSFSIKWISK